MISGFAHEYLGFVKLTDEELDNCNTKRAARGDPAMEFNNFCVKKFDYGTHGTRAAHTHKTHSHTHAPPATHTHAHEHEHVHTH